MYRNKVLEKNATSFQVWLSVADMATLLASVSITNFWSSSKDIKVTSSRFFSVSNAFLTLVDRGNTSASIKDLILVEKSAIHLA